MFKLTNVDLYWAFLNETNQLSGKYQGVILLMHR